jgi:2-polyprenyl-3-methyl-5-hydroxy-6-metoxy-1,4-benzoquinol methylase
MTGADQPAGTKIRLAMRDRLYHEYASGHAGIGDGRATSLNYRRQIGPLLPAPPNGPVLDIGCGQGELVKLLLADGYDASGVDVSPEQVAIAHKAGLAQVKQDDYRHVLAEKSGQLAAVTATDILEHLTKDEILETFDLVSRALVPGGIFVARVPNAVSPFGGHIRHGDFTHESSFTARSIHQVAVATGFGAVTVKPCTPVIHGAASSMRGLAWQLLSALLKFALAIETGEIHGHVVTQNLIFVAKTPEAPDEVAK